MYRGIVRRMRELVRANLYVLTLHAVDEMEDDGLTVFDVERGVLTGEIVERQADRDTGEWKYVIQGQTRAGTPLTVVAKLGPTGKLVVITVYLG